MDREGGSRQRMRKSWEWISLSISSFPLHFLFISSFSRHFLFISSFFLHILAARLQGCNDSCSPVEYLFRNVYPGKILNLRGPDLLPEGCEPPILERMSILRISPITCLTRDKYKVTQLIFLLFLFDSDVWLFMKGLSLEARERSLFGFFLWEVCAKVTWFMLKVGTPENMLSLNSPDFLHHKFNSSTTNQET